MKIKLENSGQKLKLINQKEKIFKVNQKLVLLHKIILLMLMNQMNQID